MQSLDSIFPARNEWPLTVDDVCKAPVDTTRLRLVAGAKNIERLPDYGGLQALWCFGIDQDSLDSIGRCTALESLYIEDVKTAKLDALSGLPTLRTLGLETCPKASSLSGLGSLHSLTGLALTHCKNVHDLEPLSEMRALKALAVAGSMWTAMTVASFEPLRALKDLEFLHLTNIKAEDHSLHALGDLTRLKHLDLPNFFPMSEFAWLSRRLPSTVCSWFQPFVALQAVKCKKCSKPGMLVLTGSRKPTLCGQCDQARIEKHLREWNDVGE